MSSEIHSSALPKGRCCSDEKLLWLCTLLRLFTLETMPGSVYAFEGSTLTKTKALGWCTSPTLAWFYHSCPPERVCKCIFYLYALIKTQTKQVCTAVNSSKHNFYHHPWPTELIVHTSSLHFEYVHPVLTISSDLLQLHNVPLSKIRSLFRSTKALSR